MVIRVVLICELKNTLKKAFGKTTFVENLLMHAPFIIRIYQIQDSKNKAFDFIQIIINVE